MLVMSVNKAGAVIPLACECCIVLYMKPPFKRPGMVLRLRVATKPGWPACQVLAIGERKKDGLIVADQD